MTRILFSIVGDGTSYALAKILETGLNQKNISATALTSFQASNRDLERVVLISSKGLSISLGEIAKNNPDFLLITNEARSPLALGANRCNVIKGALDVEIETFLPFESFFEHVGSYRFGDAFGDMHTARVFV